MTESVKNESRSSFSFLDFLRIFAGILFFNAILSYALTSSPTWGYSGKYLNPNYLAYVICGSPQVTFTVSSLAQSYQEKNKLYLSVNGTVFDVSANSDMYSTGSRYNVFIGKDCTRLFVNGCFHKEDQSTWDLRNIGVDLEIANNRIDSWVNYFENHPEYWKVGVLDLTDPVTTEPPEVCFEGMMYSSNN